MKRRIVTTSATRAALPVALGMAAVGIMATGICAVAITCEAVVRTPSLYGVAEAQDVLMGPEPVPSEVEAPVYVAPLRGTTVHAGLDDGAAQRALTVQCAKAHVMVRTGFDPCPAATGAFPVTIDLRT